MGNIKPTEAATSHYHPVAKGALTFDSRQYIQRMINGGFSERQAQTLAAEQTAFVINLATRQDVCDVKEDMENLKQDMENLKQDVENLKKDVAELKQNMVTRKDLEVVRKEIELTKQTIKTEMLKWMTWYFISGLAIMATMIKLA